MTGLYLLSIVIGILIAFVYKKVLFKGEAAPFVMELPNYRLPSLRSTLQLMWEKAKDFLQRAFTIIFVATILIWFLQTFDARLNVVTDSSQSLLAMFGTAIAPAMRPVGIGDWRIATALITGFVAKESVVSTLQILLGGAPLTSLFTLRSCLSFLVFTLLYTPCVAAISAVRRELGSGLKALGVVLAQTGVAWLVAFAVYQLMGIWL